jgi:hypothetical protein
MRDRLRAKPAPVLAISSGGAPKRLEKRLETASPDPLDATDLGEVEPLTR